MSNIQQELASAQRYLASIQARLVAQEANGPRPLLWALLNKKDKIVYGELWAKPLKPRKGGFKCSEKLVPVTHDMEESMADKDWDIWMVPREDGLLKLLKHKPQPKPSFLAFVIRANNEYYQVFYKPLLEQGDRFIASEGMIVLNEPRSLGAIDAELLQAGLGPRAYSISEQTQREMQEHIRKL